MGRKKSEGDRETEKKRDVRESESPRDRETEREREERVREGAREERETQTLLLLRE